MPPSCGSGDTAAPRDLRAHRGREQPHNTTEGHLDFHPREREDVATCSRSAAHAHLHCRRRREHPEMESLRDIDIAAFSAREPALHHDRGPGCGGPCAPLRPKIFYPYHYGGKWREKTDLRPPPCACWRA